MNNNECSKLTLFVDLLHTDLTKRAKKNSKPKILSPIQRIMGLVVGHGLTALYTPEYI
jgi:hypothetical protein